MSCFKTLKLLLVTWSPSLGSRGVATSVFDVAPENGGGKGSGVGLVAGELRGGERGAVVLTFGLEDGVYGWGEMFLTASSISSCSSGIAEAWAVPLLPLTFEIGRASCRERVF